MFMICEYGSNYFLFHVAMDVVSFQIVITLDHKTLNAKIVFAIFSNKTFTFIRRKYLT